MTEFFPGSRQPITPVSLPHDPLSGGTGKVFTIGDREVELFTISQLAGYLNRRPVTVRKWEEKGYMPKATFAKPGKGGDLRGRRRLYSRPQVEAMVRIAAEEGILQNPHLQISKTNFKAKVWKAFKEIATR